MLTINTQIPTAARGQVRALVKAHKDWPLFLTEKNLVSAQARNRDLLEFALRHAELADKIHALLMTTDNSAPCDDTTEAEESEAPAMTVNPNTGAYDINVILGSVDQFLGALVRKELTSALQPVFDAANRGPVEVERIVEVERVIEVAPGEAPRTVTPRARRDKKTTFRTLYPSRKQSPWLDAPLTLWTGVPTNAPDPFYVVDHLNMALMMTAIERGSNVWLSGPPATGKSTMPEQAAIALGRPFVKIGMTRQTEISELIGGHGLHNGRTVWEDGALIKAMRQPGCIILIDELTIAPAGVQAIIQLVADDHRSITLPTGEVVRAADGVVFVVADNTNGSGDEGGLYAGTNISNAALVTRFKRMIKVDYMSPAKEAEALANHTACPLNAARKLADLVEQARRLPALAGVVISLRQMVGFIQCCQDGFSTKDAFEITVSSRMPSTEKAAIEALIDLTWTNDFEALLTGKPLPAQASNSAASKAFADPNY